MSTDQVEFTPSELLATHDRLEPLVADGRHCHGGFDATGAYRSPRTLHRTPAIEAWQARHADTGAELLSIDLASFPEHYPNVEQTRHLLRAGVREPVVSILTRIGTVEGFGAFLRHSIVPDLQRHFDDDITGTAIAHLDRGLIEAHARDEAGFEDEAGHNLMWFAARDIAFERPVTENQTKLMLERMGITGPGGKVDLAAMRAAAIAARKLPSDIDFDVEALIERMARLMLIEITAFHAFTWAETILGDPELVAGDGEAGQIVSYIRADETPHVAYLQTVLSEMRARAFAGSGRTHDGHEIVHTIWDAAVEDSRSARRWDVVQLVRGEVLHALSSRPGGDELLEAFDALGSVRRLDDGTWIDLSRDVVQPAGPDVPPTP